MPWQPRARLEAKQDRLGRFFYRAANQIEQDAPHAYNGLADIFFDRQQTDSALYYFGLAAATKPTDPNYDQDPQPGGLQLRGPAAQCRRAPEAVTAFHRYLSLEPGD